MMQPLKFKICSMFITPQRLQRLSTGGELDGQKPQCIKDEKTNPDVDITSIPSETKGKYVEHLFAKWKRDTSSVSKTWDRYFKELKNEGTPVYIKRHPLIDGLVTKSWTFQPNEKAAKVVYMVFENSEEPQIESTNCNIFSESKKMPVSELIQNSSSNDEPKLLLGLNKNLKYVKPNETSTSDAQDSIEDDTPIRSTVEAKICLAPRLEAAEIGNSVAKLEASEGDSNDKKIVEPNALQKDVNQGEWFELDDTAKPKVQDKPQTVDLLKHKEQLLDALKYCDSRVDREAIQRQLGQLEHIELPQDNKDKKF